MLKVTDTISNEERYAPCVQVWFELPLVHCISYVAKVTIYFIFPQISQCQECFRSGMLENVNVKLNCITVSIDFYLSLIWASVEPCNRNKVPEFICYA